MTVGNYTKNVLGRPEIYWTHGFNL